MSVTLPIRRLQMVITDAAGPILGSETIEVIAEPGGPTNAVRLNLRPLVRRKGPPETSKVGTLDPSTGEINVEWANGSTQYRFHGFFSSNRAGSGTFASTMAQGGWGHTDWTAGLGATDGAFLIGPTEGTYAIAGDRVTFAIGGHFDTVNINPATGDILPNQTIGLSANGRIYTSVTGNFVGSFAGSGVFSYVDTNNNHKRQDDAWATDNTGNK
jgi:hypothetical protein